jgi:hypothetical protein
MPDLRLDRLPDRTPVKLTVTVSPDLARALADYAEVYRAAYGQREKVEELVPFMLEKFIEGDRGFAKARKVLAAQREAAPAKAGERPAPTSRSTPEKGES